MPTTSGTPNPARPARPARRCARIARLATAVALGGALVVAAAGGPAAGGTTAASGDDPQSHREVLRQYNKQLATAESDTTGDSEQSSPAGDVGDAPSTPPATSTDACGEARYKADGSQWECTFADEFDGSSLDRSKWYVHETDVDGYHSGQECMVDDPANVFVGDGALTLRVTEEPGAFTCGQGASAYRTSYTSGTVSTLNSHSQTYGRVEIRAKVEGATAPGLQSALWMWPENAYSTGTVGEIDIAEMFSQYPDRAIPTIHRWLPANNYVSNYWCMLDTSEFHDYVLEWTDEHLRISYDGELCLDFEIPAGSDHFDQPYYTVLTQALGVGTNQFQPGTTPVPASTVIDHVRIWR